MPRLLLVLFTASLACSSRPEPPTFLELPSGAAALRVDPNARELTLRRHGQVLLTLGFDAFQLGVVSRIEETEAYDPFWLYADSTMGTPPPNDLEWRKATGFTTTLSGPTSIEGTLTFDEASATLRITSDADGRFALEWKPQVTQGAIAHLRVEADADAREAFYGLGEWADQVNHRGKLRPMQMEADLTIESANDENHVPVPLLIGTRGWGVFVESRRPGVFGVATESDTRVFFTYGTAEQSSEGLRFHLFTADHPLDVTRHYYDVTGDPLLPAEWAYGPWIWRDENVDQAEVLDDAKKIRELDLATSGMWIDRPYATGVNTFDFKASTYPDPKEMIDTLHASGFRLALWHTPYTAGPDHGEAASEQHAEATAKGYFPPKSGPGLNKWSKPVDFTNPDAYAWWQQNVRRYTDLGIEGFKLDYAEDVLASFLGARTFWQFHDGSTERTMHDGYTRLYHRLYAETLPASGGFLLCRAGRWGDQRHASVIWPGDLDASFAKHREVVTAGGKQYVSVGGLPAAVIQAQTLGPSGFPFYASDTGGYRHSPPNEEVYVRWFQHTAFSAVMQVGDSSSQPPWVYTAENGRNDDTLALYRRYAREHLRLFPYVWSYAHNLAHDGRPILRALGLAHPELGVHPNDVYLLGDALLVAPVVSAGLSTRDVKLPAGDWYSWWNGTKHSGDTTLAAPLDTIPVLMKAGALVPRLRPEIDTLAPATEAGIESYANDPGKLWVRVAPGPDGSFTVFDGTKLSQKTTSTGRELTATLGSKFTGVVFELIATPEPSSVTGGEWSWSSDTLTIEGLHVVVR